MKVAEKYNIYFKWSKYDFDIKKILILRVTVRWGKVQIEEKIVKVVKECKTPTKIEVETILEFPNFYRYFKKLQLYSKTSQQTWRQINNKKNMKRHLRN